VALAVLAACLVAGTADAAHSAKAPLVIGFIGALTGPNATANSSMLDVEKQVAQGVNKHGGVAGHQVQVISADDHADPAQARVLALKMVQQDHVAALGGPLFSTEALSVTQISSQLKVPIVALQASVEQVVYPYGRAQRPYPWVFASGVSAVSQVQTMLQYCLKKGWKRVALIYQNDAFGSTDLPQFLAQAQTDKINIVLNRAIDTNVSDATPQALAISGAKPQAVIAWTNPVATAALSKSMRNNGLSTPLLANISNNTPSYYSLAGSSSENLYIPAYKVAFSTAPAVKAFTANFQKQWGFPLAPAFYPVIDGINAYLAAFAQAAKPAKGHTASSALPKPGVVQKALEKLTYKGIGETVHYSKTVHDVYDASAMLLTQVHNGVPTPVG
jgi:branched-chain amino acid transport system substrate-binding protein